MGEWLEKRRKGIGGSDAGAICGVNPYRTPLMVWEDKRGMSKAIEDNAPMYWGRALEPLIRQKYSDETGRSVLLPTEILHHKQHDFMLGNIDGFTQDGRLVEIKTTSYPTGWGEPGTDEIPLSYIFQVQHYMVITGFQVADVPVLIGGRDFRIYEVPEDKELQEMLIQKEAEFWHLVQTGVPPAPVNYEDVIRLFKTSKSKELTASNEIEEMVGFLKMIRNDMKMLEGREEEIKKTIMEFLQDADTLLNIEGKPIITWKSSKETARFNMEIFKKNHKDLYDKYLQTKESTRRFLIK